MIKMYKIGDKFKPKGRTFNTVIYEYNYQKKLFKRHMDDKNNYYDFFINYYNLVPHCVQNFKFDLIFALQFGQIFIACSFQSHTPDINNP